MFFGIQEQVFEKENFIKDPINLKMLMKLKIVIDQQIQLSLVRLQKISVRSGHKAQITFSSVYCDKIYVYKLYKLILSTPNPIFYIKDNFEDFFRFF